jgi:hypothetical protein
MRLASRLGILSRGLAFGGFAFGGLALSTACSSESRPALLGDCLEPQCRGVNVPSPSPVAINQPPTGRDAGVGVVIPDAGVAIATFPETGPGPGIGPSTGAATRGTGPGSATEPIPVCPATAPTNGAPCDPIANSIGCDYARVTCFCTLNWLCL